MAHPLAWSFGRLWHSFGVAVFIGVGLLSVGVLGLTRHRLGQSAEHAVAATDNVTSARVAVLRAQVALADPWTDSGGAASGGGMQPAVRSAAAIAELDNASARLSDLLDGRSALFGFEAEGLQGDPVGEALVERLAEAVRALRERLLSGDPPSDLDLSLAFGTLRSASAELERHVHEQVDLRLAAADRTQRIVIVAWIVFLIGLGVAGELLRRARIRALEAGRAAEQGRRVALAAHQESERRLQHLRALTDAGLLLVDGAGRIEEMSGWWARTAGFGETEWRGRPWWELFHPDERSRLADLWHDKSGRQAAFALEGRGLPQEGEAESWLSGRWRPVPSQEGGLEGRWVGTFLDVTQARSVESQLHQAQKLEAVGRMTSGVAHDFNNLLTVISTAAELLKGSHEEDPVEARELLDDIEGAAASGRDLIAGLMRFSRKEQLVIQPMDLAEVVRSTARMAAKLLHGGVELVVDVPDPGPAVHADARALQQVILNLVTNARDAMPEGGRLVLSVDEVDADASFVEERPWIEPGRFGRLTVSDTGTGMDQATLDRIFEPFFSTKAAGVGTGLGLASVHGLVRQHGGHIHAYSEVGEGTSFRVYLPMVLMEGAAGIRPHQGAREAPVALPRDPTRLRVLLVEDDDALRRTAERVLVRLGHRVESVEDGRQALELMERADGELDLVISDIAMEDIDGIELARRTRAAGGRIPFVLTSGRHASQLVGRSAIPDDVTFLPKPWSVETLQDAIREARRGA